MCLLLISAAYLPFSLLLLNPLAIVLNSILLGMGLHLLIGPKGWGIPMGSGLTMTINKAPHLNFPLSKYVMSFHVDKKFIKKRHEIIDRIAEAMNSTKAEGNEYDIVLKSWIFANRNETCNGQIKQIRKCMRSIHRAFIGIVSIALLLTALQIAQYFWGSTPLFIDGLRLIIGGLGLVIFFLVFKLCNAKKIMQGSYTDPSKNSHTDSTNSVAEKLVRKTSGYHPKFIDHRPISILQLLSLCVFTPTAVKTFAGAEAGIVLLHH